VSYFVHQNGQTYGPYPIDQLRAIWSEGRVAADALFCEEGVEQWRHIAELRSRLGPPPPPPYATTQVPRQPIHPAKKWSTQKKFFVTAGCAFGAIIFLSIVTSTPPSRSTSSRPAAPQGAAGLMSQAESALRSGEFERGADLLNQVSSEYPDSGQARTVRELAYFLRDKQVTREGPFTASEAQRLRQVMDALQKIKVGYQTASPEKRRALETILGKETFESMDTGLEALSTSGAKLRDSTDRAR
jgi:hypothetical protein